MLVGPETTCRLEPNSAATAQGTIAVARPYSGGRPARVAKAKPCGRTRRAPSRPARASARRVGRSSVRTQGPNRRDASSIMGRDCAAARGDGSGRLRIALDPGGEGGHELLDEL